MVTKKTDDNDVLTYRQALFVLTLGVVVSILIALAGHELLNSSQSNADELEVISRSENELEKGDEVSGDK